MDKIGKKQSIIERYTVLVIILLILCQLFVVAIFGIEKESYHLDELFTYGLSNSNYKPFLEFEKDSMVWHYPDFYNDYLTVQDDERFAYDSIYYNESFDMHPPFYTFGIHTLCSIFPEVFSKWFGIVFNMIFLSGTVVVLFFLSNLIFNDKYLSFVICMAYGFSLGAISNAIFIRMYIMLTFFIVLTTFLHGLLIVRKDKEIWYIIAIMIINILGFLTQYLFIVYAVFIAFGYAIYLLKQGKWKATTCYILVMIICILVSIVIFPKCLDQIFTGMGSKIISNFSIIRDSMIKFIIFILLLCNSLVIVPILFSILIIISIMNYRNRKIIYLHKLNIFKIIKNYINSNLSNENKYLYAIVFYATLFTFLVIVKISPYYTDRYISYLYPNISMISVIISYICILNLVNGNRKVILFLVAIIIICTLISYNGEVNYIYNVKQDNLDVILSRYICYDAYCIATTTANMTIAVPLLTQHKRSCYVSSSEDILNMMTESGKKNDTIVLYFPDWNEQYNIDIEILNNLVESSEFSSYKKIFDRETSGLSTNVYVLE